MSTRVDCATSHALPAERTPVPSGRREGIRIVDPLNDPHWDSSVKALPGASFFHSAAWCRVLAETYDYRPLYFIAGEPGRIDSVLPVMEVQSRLTGTRGVALPFSDHCPPLGPDAASICKLFLAAVHHGRERRWKYLELAGGRESIPEAPAATSYLGHQIDLTRNEATLFTALSSSCRRALRKAANQGVQIQFRTDQAAIRTFYNLHCKTRHRHGTPPQPYRFFSSIHRHICSAHQGTVALATWKGHTVAGAVFFHFGRQVIFKFGASDTAFQQLRANNLVMWEAIKLFSLSGLKSMHLGRTSPENAGLRAYKLGWSAEEHTIEYIRFAPMKNQFIGGRDRSSGWQTPIFRSLPASFSRIIGSALYRHFA